MDLVSLEMGRGGGAALRCEGPVQDKLLYNVSMQ